MWDSEADLEVRINRGSQALSLLVKASGPVARVESSSVVSASGRLQASRASSATSGDSHPERLSEPVANSRHSSVERAALATPSGDETEEEVEAQEAAVELERAEEAEDAAALVNDVLEPGVSKIFINANNFSFVETRATKIPSSAESSVREQFTTRIPFVETRRCIFQG